MREIGWRRRTKPNPKMENKKTRENRNGNDGEWALDKRKVDSATKNKLTIGSWNVLCADTPRKRAKG